MALDSTPSVAMATAIAGLFFCLQLYTAILFMRRAKASRKPPSAKGWVPILGHALKYKRDPAAFITEQCRRVGPCFTIDLAGKRMVIVGSSRVAVKQVASAPESVLSARQAVLDIGFAYTLGELNVTVGTDLHKRIVKQAYGDARKLADEIPQLYAAIGRGLEASGAEASDATSGANVGDLFELVRFTMLRVSLERMCGNSVLEHAGETFLRSYMRFQDRVEDATAKAAVLPRCLALPLVLWPTQRRRAAISESLASAIAAAVRAPTSITASRDATADDDGIGPWVRALVLEDGRSAADAAELICGLLFAAHKNPAIGAAQALLFALTEAEPKALAAARADAAALHASPSAETLARCEGLRAICFETLRVCAHTIGAVRTVVHPDGFDLTVGACGASDSGGSEGGVSYHLPAGTTVALAHIPTHRNTDVWGASSEAFDPSRAEWVAGAPRPDDYTFTTFSQGLHRCPGERLAHPMMQCALAQLLSGGFETTLVPGKSVPPVDFERATLAQRAAPVALNVHRRA